VTWLNNLARRWWPLVASAAAGIIIYTGAYVVVTVAEDRVQLREQRDQLAAQSAQLADIIERNDRFDASREARLARAVDDVEALLVDHFARHDENVALKLNETLERIAALLGRPASVPVDPVSADVNDRQSTPPPERAPARPEPDRTDRAEPPPSTTTTTSPGRSDLCDRIPLSPICQRENR
jgi:hypothetical protein